MEFFKNINAVPTSGNLYVDSFLLATVLPLVLAYTRQVGELCQQLLMWVMAAAARYVHERFNTRVVGEVVADVNVPVGDPLFEGLQKVVFLSPKYNNSSLHSRYGQMVDTEELDETSEKVRSKWWWRALSSRVSSETLTLSGSKDDPLTLNSDVTKDNTTRSIGYECAGIAVNLVFTFTMVKTNIVATAKSNTEKKEAREFIKMRVRAFGASGLIQDKALMADAIKAFLYKELNILDHVIYTYSIRVDSTKASDRIHKWTNCNFLSRRRGIVNYGDSLGFTSGDRVSSFTINVVDGMLENDGKNSACLKWHARQGDRTAADKSDYVYWLKTFQEQMSLACMVSHL